MAAVPAGLATALQDRYRLERELGQGGMATVYLAEDLKHQRRVAMKVLHRELSHALGAERFRREIEIAARLQHPHILTVFDSGDADGLLWYTMPFVEGESLRDLLARDRELHQRRSSSPAGGGRATARTQGVVHRDIKRASCSPRAPSSPTSASRARCAGTGRLTTGVSIGRAYMSRGPSASASSIPAATSTASPASPSRCSRASRPTRARRPRRSSPSG
jgi:serine/threonine-protein kinase